jgi:choline dehydrogenase-like flavoprotein
MADRVKLVGLQPYAAIGVLGEILPDARNAVTIHATEKDQFGIPAPYARFSLFDNDRRMMRAGIAPAKAVLEAVGATHTSAVNRYAHLVGTCRTVWRWSDWP